jgi:hypothetical protein
MPGALDFGVSALHPGHHRVPSGWKASSFTCRNVHLLGSLNLKELAPACNYLREGGS